MAIKISQYFQNYQSWHTTRLIFHCPWQPCWILTPSVYPADCLSLLPHGACGGILQGDILYHALYRLYIHRCKAHCVRLCLGNTPLLLHCEHDEVYVLTVQKVPLWRYDNMPYTKCNWFNIDWISSANYFDLCLMRFRLGIFYVKEGCGDLIAWGLLLSIITQYLKYIR